HATGELGEDLPEHALAAVAVDDALVVDEVGRGRRERVLRHALGGGALLEVGEETLERHAVMAGRTARRRGRCGGTGRCCRHWLGRYCRWPAGGNNWSGWRRCWLGRYPLHSAEKGG